MGLFQGEVCALTADIIVLQKANYCKLYLFIQF